MLELDRYSQSLMLMKTVYKDRVADWGVLGIVPKRTGQTVAWMYADRHLVLLVLAQHRKRSPKLAGYVFAVCTLTGHHGPTQELCNPS